MEPLILDTGTLVALERGGGMVGSEIADSGVDIAIAAVTAAELLVGVELADAAHRPVRRSFVEGILSRVQIIPFDLSIARAHAQLLAHVRRAGTSRGAHDLQIAATARVANRTVLTSDRAAFADLPAVDYRIVG